MTPDPAPRVLVDEVCDHQWADRLDFDPQDIICVKCRAIGVERTITFPTGEYAP